MMESAPVTAVIPCFRCVQTIRSAVESVASQTRRPAELILVDDGSGDDTLEMLRAVQAEFGADWIRVLELRENRGAAEARNAGWDAATQKYVAFLDADDTWHPRKIEHQVRFMEQHREFGVSGHAHRRVRGDREWTHVEPADGYERITHRQLLLSNQFITPSAMVLRDLPARFPAGGRHMEDYGLWLDLSAHGVQIAKLEAELAYIYKAPYGEGGLSANLIAMERAELGVYFRLFSGGRLPVTTLIALVGLSLAKFARRLLVHALRPSPRSFPWLFPAAYLTVSHSTTALLVFASVFGQAELGAEVGIISGATIATFHAFSANTRMLILARSEILPAQTIVAWRIALLGPLCLAAGWLALQVPGVAASLTAALVVRRAVEWLNEVHLSEAELHGHRALAAWFLVVQSALLGTVVALLALRSDALLAALFLWALAPLAFTVRFLARNARLARLPSRVAVLQLAGHSGSTAVSGLSTYALRVLLLFMLGKAAAGDLFAAIAIGSFMGTLVANVVGPSVELHRARFGGALPGVLRLAMLVATVAGAALVVSGAAIATGPLGLGKSPFFWRAVGFSLLGGPLMVVAQFVRLRIIRLDDARDVLGPDVLAHMALLTAVPLLAIAFGPDGLEAVYLANAAVAYGFYKSAELAHRSGGWTLRTGGAAWLLAVLIFAPVFFQLTGQIYDVREPVIDSGGLLRTLPLPISLVACALAVLLLGNYSRAALGYGVLFLSFAMLTLSTIMSTQGDLGATTGKLLLLGQTVLPFLALPLGMQYAGLDRGGAILARAIIAVLAVVIPAQLVATWTTGETQLGHRVFVFSVYQNLQYVPVVLALSYGIALNTLWSEPRHRTLLAVIGPLVGIYTVAALANLAIAALIAMVGLFVVLHRPGTGRGKYVVVVLGTPVAMATYFVPVAINPAFLEKYPRIAEAPLMARLTSHLITRCAQSEVRIDNRGVTPGPDGCRIDAEYDEPWNWIMLTRRLSTGDATVLIAEGELRKATLRVGLLERGQWKTFRDISEPGPFHVTIEAEGRNLRGAVAYLLYAPRGRVEATVRSLVLTAGTARVPASTTNTAAPVLPAAPSGPAAVAAPGGPTLPDTVPPPTISPGEPIDASGSRDPGSEEWIPQNLRARLEDWVTFGAPIFSSPSAFFFGHAQPMDRTIRTSAHNYYIDLAYNFGVLALLPILVLLGITLSRVASLRVALLRNPALVSILAATLYLVLIDSSFKVTLRQPYPGIAAFFLWGVLLAYLRQFAANGEDLNAPQRRLIQNEPG